jgi:hypothetical protein
LVEHQFYPGLVPRKYLNDGSPPPDAPTKNMGAIPVFVRLVDSELGERYLPGEARSWTRSHVMVSFVDPADTAFPNSVTLAWVPASDVWRVVKRAESNRPQLRRRAPP